MFRFNYPEMDLASHGYAVLAAHGVSDTVGQTDPPCTL